MRNALYPLDKVIEIMKPCKVSDSNPNHIAKLNKCIDSIEYIVEEKIDGCHYNCIGNRFFSTHLSEKTGYPVEKTENFPHLTEIFQKLNLPIVLDGEINYMGKRSQDVTPVTGASPDKAVAYQEQNGYVQYTIYDVLKDSNGNDLCNKPWRVRREILEGIGAQLTKLTKFITVNPVIWTDKGEFIKRTLQEGKEGGVLKHVNGLYYPGKRPMWNQIKVKQGAEDDVVIMDFEPPEQYYTGKDVVNWPHWEDGEPVTKLYANGWVGAMIIGKYNTEGQLVRVGTVSGMTDSERALISQKPSDYIGKVAHIKFMEKTNDGNYRHASFVQLHQDKNAFECVLDKA